jgi:O-antigen ligase/polysaccharide polymerase Wzy-like membrane protein
LGEYAVLQRAWCVVVFLLLTAELPHFFEKHWSTPWHYIGDALFAPIPGIRLPYLDAVIGVFLVLAVFSRSRNAADRAKPVVVAVWVSMASLLAWGGYGLLRGGSAFEARFQLHIPVVVLISALTQINLLRSPKHFRMLGKAIVYAALFRFAMMFVFYITIMRSLNAHIETVTDHGDSMLFVTCIVIVLANALHERTRKSLWAAGVVAVLMLWCTQINGRRLAWIGLVGSLVVMYALFRIGPLRRRINRYLLRTAPLLAVYIAVGWSHPTGIFKPIASLQSVTDKTNPSTQSRILEDQGLIVTFQNHPLMGTGFGHEYIQISQLFSVESSIFPEYRYVPHNSVLGLVAFTGAGFVAIWMVLPITVYLSARAYAFAQTPLLRTVALVSVCEVLVYVNQLWADIGILAPGGIVFLGSAVAAASRASVWTGAWPGRKERRARVGEPGAAVPTRTRAAGRGPMPA